MFQGELLANGHCAASRASAGDVAPSAAGMAEAATVANVVAAVRLRRRFQVIIVPPVEVSGHVSALDREASASPGANWPFFRLTVNARRPSPERPEMANEPGVKFCVLDLHGARQQTRQLVQWIGLALVVVQSMPLHH